LPDYFSQSNPNQSLDNARTGLAIFYQSVIITIALGLAIGFLGEFSQVDFFQNTLTCSQSAYGSRVLWILGRIKSMSERVSKLRKNKMIKFSFLLAICTVALLCMTGFLLYGTISQSMSAVGAIIFVILVEIIPLTLLIFTVYSKQKSMFKIWYNYAVTARSSTTTTTTTTAVTIEDVSSTREE